MNLLICYSNNSRAKFFPFQRHFAVYCLFIHWHDHQHGNHLCRCIPYSISSGSQCFYTRGFKSGIATTGISALYFSIFGACVGYPRWSFLCKSMDQHSPATPSLDHRGRFFHWWIDEYYRNAFAAVVLCHRPFVCLFSDGMAGTETFKSHSLKLLG